MRGRADAMVCAAVGVPAGFRLLAVCQKTKISTSSLRPDGIRSTRLRGCQDRKRRRRRLLVTTDTEEKAMAPAAIFGSSRPAAARGMAATL